MKEDIKKTGVMVLIFLIGIFFMVFAARGETLELWTPGYTDQTTFCDLCGKEIHYQVYSTYDDMSYSWPVDQRWFFKFDADLTVCQKCYEKYNPIIEKKFQEMIKRWIQEPTEKEKAARLQNEDRRANAELLKIKKEMERMRKRLLELQELTK